MKNNILTIQIHKPVHEVFRFCITPPNSTKWIPSVIKEETNEWPVRMGTIYTLQYDNGDCSDVIVSDFEENKFVEWISKDKNYHCRYTIKSVRQNMSEFEYKEWVDIGILEAPFTLEILKKLKHVLESL